MKKIKPFRCIEGCSDCCIEREYYPSERFGRIGVLLLPSEKEMIEQNARSLGIQVRIVPRLGVGASRDNIRIIAYQMMGKQSDGRLCPFLDVEGSQRAPNGGYRCKIYSDRPLACRAYPIIDTNSACAILDEHCRFCTENSGSAQTTGLQNEIEALAVLSSVVKADAGERVWRYATATGDSNSDMLQEGWVAEW